MNFTINTAPISTNSIRKSCLHDTAGGFASFEGWVRNHHEGRAVQSLEYSCYQELALKEGQRIVTAALEQFPIIHAHCEHRVGHLAIGDMAVYVAVSAAHRDAAFTACRFIIDEIKQRVPIWKKEYYADGSTAWPHCHQCAAGTKHTH